MNSIFISKKHHQVLQVGLVVALFSVAISHVHRLSPTPISGYNGLDVLLDLLTNKWVQIVSHYIYVLFLLFMMYLTVKAIPQKNKLLRGALWTAIITYLVTNIYLHVIPMPADIFSSLNTWRTVGHGIISILSQVSIFWAGYLFYRNHGGRLRQLGIILMAWILINTLLNSTIAFVFAVYVSKAMDVLYSVIRVLMLAAVLIIFYRCFIPEYK